MTIHPLLLVLIGSFLAAGGQLFLKLGADGATAWSDYLNGRLAIGFALYGVGSALWVMALSKWPLSKVYPFTILTFVLVYVSTVLVLGERISGQVIGGALLVLTGLVVIATA